MSVKILITEDLKVKFNEKSLLTKENKNTWYYILPFWYMENEYGVVSVYDKDEVPKDIKNLK